MKSAMPSVATLVFVFAASSASAQSRVIAEAEYEAILKPALAEAERHDRRVSTTTWHWSAGKLTSREDTVEEFQAPDSHRLFIKMEAGKKSLTKEVIDIGDASYRREDSVMWSKWRRQKEPNKTIAVTSDPKDDVSYTVEDGHAGEIHLLKSVTTKGLSPERRTAFIWIKNRRVVRLMIRVTTHDDKTSDHDLIESSMSTYIYDPKDLKIRSPISE